MYDLHHHLAGRGGVILVIRAPRELNHDTADTIRTAVTRGLPNADGAAAVFDLADVQIMTSIGIAALLQVQEHCADRGARLILARVPERQLAFMRMLKLERKFEFAPSVEDAVAMLEGPP
ncbi:MAG: STAS domain-containing protein [Planctomycetota bacterium]|nr:STAS domain-containing protein [Planctomycetota bacterium]